MTQVIWYYFYLSQPLFYDTMILWHQWPFCSLWMSYLLRICDVTFLFSLVAALYWSFFKIFFRHKFSSYNTSPYSPYIHMRAALAGGSSLTYDQYSEISGSITWATDLCLEISSTIQRNINGHNLLQAFISIYQHINQWHHRWYSFQPIFSKSNNKVWWKKLISTLDAHIYTDSCHGSVNTLFNDLNRYPRGTISNLLREKIMLEFYNQDT